MNQEDDKPRILLTCLAPDRKEFHQKVLTLFRTIKAFGGNIADSKLVANFENHIDPEVERRLKDLGVKVRLVEPFDSNLKHSNKLRMLETEEDYDMLLCLDCDTAVAEDFSHKIIPDRFQAKPVDQDPLSIQDWNRIYSLFEVDLPSKRYRTSFHQKETIAYFNSGVLSIPRAYVECLRRSWAIYVRHVSNSLSSFSDTISEYIKVYLDQVALSLALAAENIPVAPFSLDMNFPTHYSIDPSLLPDGIQPYILHYHDRTSKGFPANLTRKGLLLKTGYRMPDLAIIKINEILKRPLTST